MQIADNSPKKAFTIEGVGVEVPMPFKSGHSISEGEASALNQTLSENVRNNLASKVKALKGEDGKTPVKVADVQGLVDAYLLDYEFGVRSGGGRQVDPVKALALELARSIVRKQVKDSGGKLTDITRAEITERAEKMLTKNPKIMAVAQKNIDEQKTLADLL